MQSSLECRLIDVNKRIENIIDEKKKLVWGYKK